MNEKIRKLLEDCCRGYGFKTISDNAILEVLREQDPVYTEKICKHRWWDEYRYIVKIKDIFIGYVYAESNRDESVRDLGYEFDISTVCEMKPIEKVITVYEPVE